MNFTNLTASNTTLEMISVINLDWTGGLLGIFLLLVLAVVIFINLSYNQTKDTFLFVSFYVTIISGFMWLLGLVGQFVFIVCTIILFFGVMLSILTGDR